MLKKFVYLNMWSLLCAQWVTKGTSLLCKGREDSDQTELMPKLIIRIYLECEGRIKKSVPRITVWHHEACRVMTNGDARDRFSILPSHE